MLPEFQRIEANGGRDFTLATGLARLRRQVIDTIDHDAVLVLDTHWATTTETVITAHTHRSGRFTSDEMPTEISQIPYAIPGDPELAHAVAAVADRNSLWLSTNNDSHLPIHYATLNLWSYLGRPGVPWLSISICQTATTKDHLHLGAAVAEAVTGLPRRVLVIASGGLSHCFWPLAELRDRMAGAPANIISSAARAADEQRVAWLESGRHDRVIATMPEYRRHTPEGNFGHYLTLAGTLGGSRCTASARRYSEYENAIGTGQVHLWFDHPAEGWTT
ncbi:catechol 1,2-dioxygenase [Streptomyces rimosus]|uniref:DODA-type extradiol aromatic ring-opening family dioxygenase n=1 Tax=Streptomyces rimosus TaxID=1927 RepID=UPI001F170201|nr:catechol 1,2-dioxygenase [Streptomyces rimosus]